MLTISHCRAIRAGHTHTQAQIHTHVHASGVGSGGGGARAALGYPNLLADVGPKLSEHVCTCRREACRSISTSHANSSIVVRADPAVGSVVMYSAVQC